MRYGARFHVTQEDVATFKKMLKEGMSYDEIAKATKRRVGDIYMYINGPLKPRREKTRRCPCCSKKALHLNKCLVLASQDDFEYLLSRRNSNKTLREIAEARSANSAFGVDRLLRLLSCIRFWKQPSWEVFRHCRDKVGPRVYGTLQEVVMCEDCGPQVQLIDSRTGEKIGKSKADEKRLAPLNHLPEGLNSLTERELLGLLLKKMYGNMESSTPTQRTA